MGTAGGSEPFGAWTLHELLEELASEAPAPGGGPLAGMVVAMAAALVAKVARGSAEAWPEAAQVAERALELRDRAHWLAGADLDAHLRALEALRSTDRGGLGDALAHAAEMPLALAGTAADVALLAAEAAARGVPDRSADAQAAALLAAAAARASARLVEVNLATLPHDERVQAALERARAAEAAAGRPRIHRVLTPRQELLLAQGRRRLRRDGPARRLEGARGRPRGDCGPSTVRNELAVLEEHGLLAHPHTSAGRVPDRRRLPLLRRPPAARRRSERRRGCELELVRREVDEAMRMTTETLSQVTNLLAIVSAPPIETRRSATSRCSCCSRRSLMVVIITSTGGVSKRMFTLRAARSTPASPTGRPRTSTSSSSGMGLGARMLHSRLADPSLPPTERAFLDALAPAFTELAETAEDTLYVDGAARLLSEHRFQDVSQLNALHGDARAPRVAARCCCRGARRARRLRPHRRRERGCRRCARCRWSPPTTACRSATSARSR